jgi:hypothetical protein
VRIFKNKNKKEIKRKTEKLKFRESLKDSRGAVKLIKLIDNEKWEKVTENRGNFATRKTAFRTSSCCDAKV